MNACTWASCGMCGRCDDGIGEHPDSPELFQCDYCGKDAIYPVTLAGVGVCCSRDCMNVLEHKQALILQARHVGRRSA